MSWILLTNDDGIGSPALAPFAEALAGLGTVRVCVPDRERSWIGKAMTRQGDVRVDRVDALAGTAGTWTCSGTPGDSANVGIHTLADDLPSLVVSGINVGSNVGTAYLLSSGTVGAAFEGFLAGVPSVAVSTNSVVTTWGEWVRHATSPEARTDWSRLAGLGTTLVDDVVAAGLADTADVVSINVPWDATVATPRRVTDVARTGYGAVLPERDGPRRFTYDGVLRRMDDARDGDVDVFLRGEVSITPLRAPSAMEVDEALRARVERSSNG